MDLPLHPHLPGPHIPEPRICCLRATGEVREARRVCVCCPEQGPVSISPCLLGPVFLLGGKRVGDPLLLVELPTAALASGMAACGSTSQSLSMDGERSTDTIFLSVSHQQLIPQNFSSSCFCHFKRKRKNPSPSSLSNTNCSRNRADREQWTTNVCINSIDFFSPASASIYVHFIGQFFLFMICVCTNYQRSIQNYLAMCWECWLQKSQMLSSLIT